MKAEAERAASSGDRETLQLLIGGGDGEPERLLLLERPTADGRVRVRSWTSEDWSASPNATEYDAHDILKDVERWSRAGRSLNHPLSVVRRWLG